MSLSFYKVLFLFFVCFEETAVGSRYVVVLLFKRTSEGYFVEMVVRPPLVKTTTRRCVVESVRRKWMSIVGHELRATSKKPMLF